MVRVANLPSVSFVSLLLSSLLLSRLSLLDIIAVNDAVRLGVRLFH